MRVRSRRFNEDGQAMPRGSSGSVTPVRLDPHPGSLQRSCLRLRALPNGVVIWYTDLLENPSLAQGTQTPQTCAHDGRTQSHATEPAVGPVLKSTHLAPAR
jgi:hypothetical protein